MSQLLNSISLTGVAASLAKAMDVPPPNEARPSIEALDQLIQTDTAHGKVDRIFMYNPDAISNWVHDKYTYLMREVRARTEIELPYSCVMPSVTPVCFGTMYTGAQP